MTDSEFYRANAPCSVNVTSTLDSPVHYIKGTKKKKRKERKFGIKM